MKNRNIEINQDYSEESLIRRKFLTPNRKKILDIVVFLLTPVALWGLMILTLNYTTKIWYYLKPKPVIFSLLLLEVIHMLLTAITGNSKRSTIIQAILLWILEFVNKLRYTYTYEPLTFGDFIYASNAGEIGTLMKETILKTLWGMVPIFCFLAVVLVILIWIVSKCNIKANKSFRICGSLVPLMILIILFVPNKSVKTFMLNKVFDKDKAKDYRHNSSNMQYYSEYTMLGGMYANLLESRIFEPDDYDKAELAKILKEYDKKETENTWEKANIIVTFSESFFDISVIEEDVTFSTPVTSNFNRLKEEGIFVNMITPSYGGISANVEFEFLTGYSLDFFGKGYTPFMSLYNNDRVADRHSLVKELKNNGYYTKVVFGKDFFNSEHVYERLGINEYEEKNDKAHRKGYYTSDEYLIDGAIEALQNKKEDEKLFYMNCTIESHMPFVEKKYDSYDFEIESSSLNPAQTSVIKSYAQSCYDADKELGRLYDFIQTFEEPTIIVFYGDHLPYLSDPDTSEDLLNELKYFNTGDDLLDSYRKYNTQALILANFDMGENENLEYLSPDLLLPTITNKMGLDLSSYYKWLYNHKNELPSSNYLVSQDIDGKLYWTENLNKKQQEYYDLREKMQYYVLIDGEK
ncbi:MAG: sulfatase-like hydrolase/transferase [Clostridia bacterium]|nr:sulfatase-like hydrolase/transferase [Clostridia bacterium]